MSKNFRGLSPLAQYFFQATPKTQGIEKDRVARILNKYLLGILIFIFLNALIAIPFFYANKPGMLLILAIMTCFVLFIKWILWSGRIRAASLTFIVAFWLITNSHIFLTPEPISSIVFYIFVLILSAALLLGQSWALFFAIMTVLVTSFRLFVPSIDALAVPLFPDPPLAKWIDLTTSLILLLFSIYIAMEDIKESLRISRENESRFLAIFNSVQESVILLSPQQGTIAEVNNRIQDLFGYPPAEVINRKMEIFCPANEDKYSSDNFHVFLENTESVPALNFEWRFLHRDGHSVWVDVSLGRTRILNEEYVIATLRNISGRKEADRLLKISYDWLSRIIHLSNVIGGLGDIRSKARVLADELRTAFAVDSCVIRMVQDDQLVLLAQVGIPENLLNETMPANFGIARQILEEKKAMAIQNVDTDYATSEYKDHLQKNYYFISYAGAPLIVNDQVIGMVGIYSEKEIREFSAGDLDNLRIFSNNIAIALENERLFEQLQQSRDKLEIRVRERTSELEKSERQLRSLNSQLQAANQELESFSYSVSHDLRAPLRAVLGFSQALQEDCQANLPDDGLEYLERIQGAANRMSQLIEDLLKLSRDIRGELQKEEVDLIEMADDILEDSKKANPSANFQCTVSGQMKVFCDRRMIRIVLENLIGNAVKFSSKNTTPQIDIYPEHQANQHFVV